jgi:hypothetical protein
VVDDFTGVEKSCFGISDDGFVLRENVGEILLDELGNQMAVLPVAVADAEEVLPDLSTEVRLNHVGILVGLAGVGR